MTINLLIDMVWSMGNNIFLLLSTAFLYSFRITIFERKKQLFKVVNGVIIGIIAIFIMKNPFVSSSGIIFDTRTILLALTVIYFSNTTGIIAGVIAASYRLYLGGEGAIIGALVIGLSLIVGFIWKFMSKKYKYKNKFNNKFIEYYLLGLFVNGISLSLILFIPGRFYEMLPMTIMAIIIFPFITILLGVILDIQKERIEDSEIQRTIKLFIDSSIDAKQTLSIYKIDDKYRYISFNLFHKEKMKNLLNSNIEIGQNHLDAISDEKLRKKAKEVLDRALKGHKIEAEGNAFPVTKQIFKYYFLPVYENDKQISVAVFSYDITEQKEYEESILKLSYYDVLTNLPNRRFFQEEIDKFNQNTERILVVIFDINGLKLINDTFGHESGDEFIILVANELQKVIKERGRVFRIGGDEFACLIPTQDRNLTENIVKEIEDHFKNKKYRGVNVSVSCGTSFKDYNDDLKETIIESEQKMYNHKLNEKLSRENTFIEAMLKAMQEKYPKYVKHANNVKNISVKTGEELKMTSYEINLLEIIASLHDIGKIAIDDQILNKKEKLTDDEWKQIKKHPEIGYRIMSSSPQHVQIAEDILSHHERYDGKGYPRGLKGNDIPLRARIIAVANSYDAMISNRPYRKALTKEEALEEIISNKGTQFDPKIVDIFLKIIEKEEVIDK